MTNIKHSNLIRDLILHSNENNIDIAMDIINMFEDIEECSYKNTKMSWYSSGNNNISIKISSDYYCYLLKFYQNKYQICTINDKSTEWTHVNYNECKRFLRTLIEQTNVLLESRYEVGELNG